MKKIKKKHSRKPASWVPYVIIIIVCLLLLLATIIGMVRPHSTINH